MSKEPWFWKVLEFVFIRFGAGFYLSIFIYVILNFITSLLNMNSPKSFTETMPEMLMICLAFIAFIDVFFNCIKQIWKDETQNEDL